MKIHDLLDMMDEPQTGDQMLNVLKTVLIADDLSREEKRALAVGFTIGAVYVLANHNEGTVERAALGVMRMMQEFERTVYKDGA